MTLPTRSQLPIALPLVAAASESVSLDRLRTGVGIRYSHSKMLNIRGREAHAITEVAYHKTADAVGAVVGASHGTLICLRRDQLALLTGDVHRAAELLQAVPASSLLTVTDVTHGHGFILLEGARAADVLSKICGLNFSDLAFPDWHAEQTMLAKVRALVVRCDARQHASYEIIVDRSLAAYVWDVVVDAMQEFDGVILSDEHSEMLDRDDDDVD